MARPHHALVEIAAGRPAPPVVADPEAMLRSAEEHRMTGVLWRRVADGEIVVPRALALDLAARDVAVRSHHAALARALVDVTARLAARGIGVATFKGITAEARWYAPGERPCTDVDLLVAPDDRSRLAELVEELAPSYPFRDGLPGRVDRGIQHGVDVAVNGVAVDVHLEVVKLGVRSRTTDLVWQRTVPCSLPDHATVLALDAEAQLFSFLTHLVKDRLPTLLGFVDIVRVVGRGVDWDAVGRLARPEGLDAALGAAVDTVFDSLDLPRPAHGLGAGRGRPVAWRVLCRPDAVLQGLWPAGRRPRRLLLMPLVLQGRRREVATALARRALPPRDVARVLYAGRSWPSVERLRRIRDRRAAADRHVSR